MRMNCTLCMQDAVRGDHGEVATLLVQRGGKVIDKLGQLVDLSDSPLAGNVRIFTDYDPDWEIEPVALQLLDKIGEGEFGVVYKVSEAALIDCRHVLVCLRLGTTQVEP